MSAVPEFLETCEDRYRLASFDLSGFTVYTLLRGFENAMEDLLADLDGFAVLMDAIIDFECDLMRLAARYGFHGIHFADDWGTQSGLMISPAMWRRCSGRGTRGSSPWLTISDCTPGITVAGISI